MNEDDIKPIYHHLAEIPDSIAILIPIPIPCPCPLPKVWNAQQLGASAVIIYNTLIATSNTTFQQLENRLAVEARFTPATDEDRPERDSVGTHFLFLTDDGRRRR